MENSMSFLGYWLLFVVVLAIVADIGNTLLDSKRDNH